MNSKTTLALTKYVPLLAMGAIVILAFVNRQQDPDVSAYEKLRDARSPEIIRLSDEQLNSVSPLGNAASLVVLPGDIADGYALLCVNFDTSGVSSQLVRMRSGNPEGINNHRVGALIREDQPCRHVRGLIFDGQSA
ncbi:hypothetical protein KUV57_12220 [Epibacterium sp. DP7N7-1]|nr:hypothetical protein [Epibacterium sp. DP7N7-1]